jgi:hypothetical protein
LAFRRGEPAADDPESAAAWHVHHVKDLSVLWPHAEHASVRLGGPNDALVSGEELGNPSTEVSHHRVGEGDGFDPDQRAVTRTGIDSNTTRIGSECRGDDARVWTRRDVCPGGRADVELRQRRAARARHPELRVAERECERMRYGDAMHDSAEREVEDVDPSARVGDDPVTRPNEPHPRSRQEQEIDGSAETGECAQAPVATTVDLSDNAKVRICDEDAAAVDRRRDRSGPRRHRQSPQHLPSIAVDDREATLGRQQDEAANRAASANRTASTCAPREREYGKHGD